MSDDRRFSREEVSLVLQKVAERSISTRRQDGFTRAELREIVEEAGLSASEVDGAIAELETRHKANSHLLGLPRWVVVRHRLDAELDPARLQRLSKLINRSVGTIGRSEIDEQGLSWFGRHVNVSITREHGQVAVDIEERFHNTVRGQLGLATMGALAGAFLLVTGAANLGLTALGVVLAALVPVLTYLALRATHGARIRATRARLELLGHQIVGALNEPNTKAPPALDAGASARSPQPREAAGDRAGA